MNQTAVAITIIICATLVILSWMGQGKNNGGRKE